MKFIDVSAIEIRDYAQSLNWTLVKEALQEGLFVLNSPDGSNTQLLFPKEVASSSFQELAYMSLKRLAEYYKKSIEAIAEDIREVNDDVIGLRFYSANKTVNSISFEEAYETIAATRQLILSAASTVVNPQLYHPWLNRAEPQEIIKNTKFRHTEEGSFIIKVSIPFENVFSHKAFFNDTGREDMPIGRQTIEVISQSSQAIIDAIETNSIQALYIEESKKTNPIISYNFCDALIKVFDDERELPFELLFNWSKSSALMYAVPTVPQRVAFPFDYKPKLQELKNYLAPATKAVADTFYATVESLNGDIECDGRRSGEVTLAVLIENEIVRTRANLDAEKYKTAIEAHQQGGAYVMAKGILNRQNKVGLIEKITAFSLVS